MPTQLIPKDAVPIAAYRGEHYIAEAMRFQRDGQECVVIEAADADIDADGANGQNGGPWAYQIDDKGSEALANGGFRRHGDGVIAVGPWGNNILIVGDDGYPKSFDGKLASKTSYHYPPPGGKTRDEDERAWDDWLKQPEAYVDSETVPYAVVDMEIIRRTSGAVLGCRVVMTNLSNGCVSEGMVADVGPRGRFGEVSIAAARQLGLDPSPRTGGTERPIIRYEIFPGRAAVFDGKPVRLLRSSGKFLP